MNTELDVKTDVNLQHRVLEELDWEPSVDAAVVGVIAHEGIVTLTGHVPVYAQKLAAEDVAKRVHGVKAVANEIEVRPEGVHVHDDEDIAAAAVHTLEWDAGVPENRVQVTVRDGWITLDGSVDHQFQKSAVERAVRHLKGMRGVTSTIRIQPGESSTQTHDFHGLKECIEAALTRSSTLNPRRIAVDVQQGNVILTGDVHSLTERDEAERIAWAASGVAHVENLITVTPWGHGPAEEWGY